MQQNIATLICSVFILTIFIVDSRRKTEVSIYHWIPFIWLLIVGSRPVVQWMGRTATSDVHPTIGASSSRIDAIILSVLIAIGVLILLRRRKICIQILKNNRWVIVLLLYCGLSISWSDYPFISFKRWFRGLGTFIMVLVVLTEANPLETVKTMLRRCAFLFVPMSILFIKYFRDIGVYYESWGAIGYCGVTTGKNQLGRLCLILGLYFFWEIFINGKDADNNRSSPNKTEMFVNIFFLIIVFWLLRKANSATSLGCFLLAIFTMLTLKSVYIRRNIISIVMILLFLGSIIFFLDLTREVGGMIVKSLNRDLTFTGRTEIWKLSLKFAGNPFLGVGYDSFWLGERLQRFWQELGGARIIQAHNGYIDAYLQIGIIGVLLFLEVIFLNYKKITKTMLTNYKIGIFQLTFLVTFLLYNLTEDAFKLHSFFWFAVLLIGFLENQNEDSTSKLLSSATILT